MAVRQYKSKRLQLHLKRRTLKYHYSLDSYDISNVGKSSNAIYSVFKSGVRYLLALGAPYYVFTIEVIIFLFTFIFHVHKKNI